MTLANLTISYAERTCEDCEMQDIGDGPVIGVKPIHKLVLFGFRRPKCIVADYSRKLLLGCEHPFGEGLHGLGGPDGRVKATVIDGADGILNPHCNGRIVAGQAQNDLRVGEDGEGADLVVGESAWEQ